MRMNTRLRTYTVWSRRVNFYREFGKEFRRNIDFWCFSRLIVSCYNSTHYSIHVLAMDVLSHSEKQQSKEKNTIATTKSAETVAAAHHHQQQLKETIHRTHIRSIRLRADYFFTISCTHLLTSFSTVFHLFWMLFSLLKTKFGISFTFSPFLVFFLFELWQLLHWLRYVILADEKDDYMYAICLREKRKKANQSTAMDGSAWEGEE